MILSIIQSDEIVSSAKCFSPLSQFAAKTQPFSMVAELVQWAKTQGLELNEGIEFRGIGENNTGAFYTTNNGEKPYIRLPVELAITVDSALRSFGQDLEALRDQCDSSNTVLKLCLARERSRLKNSTIKKYLECLPTLQQMNTPYCWDAETKRYLQGTNLGSSLKENIGVLVEEWWKIINLLPDLVQKPEQHFVNMKYYYESKFYTDDDAYAYFVTNEDPANWTSFPNFLWASIILKSRSFPAYLIADAVDWDVKRHDTMLLPVIDLLNHLPSAHVEWGLERKESKSYFVFKSDDVKSGSQLFNNYGMKGNEELLLAYGFCLEDNSSDVSALKIKVPPQLLPQLQQFGVRLPRLEDHTNSIVEKPDTDPNDNENHEGLYFLKKNVVPPDLILLFQVLVKNEMETEVTLRMKLAGLNQLRKALEAKADIHAALKVPDVDNDNYRNMKIYVESQKVILASCVKQIKHIEKDMLADPNIKPRLISLKTVYKNDLRFQQSLLVTLGVTSYDTLIENQLQDQCWLLWLMSCYNRPQYIKLKDDEEENYLPEWVHDAFVKLKEKTTVSAMAVVQHKELYQELVVPLSQMVPEIYGVGSWKVEDMVVSGLLLDAISFHRGKNQECILVGPST